MLFNNRNLSFYILCAILYFPGLCCTDDVYVLNYINLFVKIAEEIPSKYAGIVEIVKPDLKTDCPRAKYAAIYRNQKNQYAEIVKEMEKYLKNQKLLFAERCTGKYILDILKNVQKYVNESFEVKIRWADCNIPYDQANKQFETLWNNLFYTFNEKTKPKKVYEKEGKVPDSPMDDENYSCIKNAPYLFCEVVHYFLFRFSVVRGQDDKTLYKLKKKVDFTKSMSDIVNRVWQDSLRDICIEPVKIDYMQESDNEPEFDIIIQGGPRVKEEEESK